MVERLLTSALPASKLPISIVEHNSALVLTASPALRVARKRSWTMPPTNRRRARSVSVLLTEEEFLRLEDFCTERGHKKSTLIARLIRRYLDAEEIRTAQATAPFNSPENS